MGAREGERTEHVGPFLTEVRTLGELEGAKARAEEDARSMREEEERGLLDSQKLRAAIETGGRVCCRRPGSGSKVLMRRA
eukprot:1696195-Rhodomonas_salina.1